MPFGLGFFATAGVSAAAGSYELITSQILTGSQASVTFSNLGDYSSTYKHLQIRAVARSAQTGSNLRAMAVRLNGVSSSSYAYHVLEGSGSSVSSFAGSSQSQGYIGHLAAAGAGNDIFAVSVIDILDPYSTTKNKTLRGLAGGTSSGENRIRLYSTLFASTNTVSSITLYSEDLTSNLVSGSRFSLYGIKG